MTAAEKEYGGALYALAAEEHCEDAVLEGLTLAADAFRETPGLPASCCRTPRCRGKNAWRMLDEAFGAERARLCAEFFEDTVREIRTSAWLRAACRQYKALLYEARGILPVHGRERRASG